MTTREARGLAAVDSEEESIAAYLQRNPEFFERHQAVLARMRLPHVRGGSTISLVERQIEGLRENFDTSHSVMVLIGEYPDLAPQRFVRCVAGDEPHLKSFETLFTSGRP